MLLWARVLVLVLHARAPSKVAQVRCTLRASCHDLLRGGNGGASRPSSPSTRVAQAVSEAPSRKIRPRREGGLTTRRTPRTGSTVAAAWQSAMYILKAALVNRSPAPRCSSWGPRRRVLCTSKRCLCRLRGIGVPTDRVSGSRRRSTHCPRCRRSTPSRIARCPRHTTFGTCPVENPRTWAATRWGRSTSSRRLSFCAGSRATRGTWFFSEKTKKNDISAAACSIRRESQFYLANSCKSVAASREDVPDSQLMDQTPATQEVWKPLWN